ncbi:UNVERIFIED_ORG: anti-sigma factor antagonist [Bacillus sp. AZ43]
MPLLDAALVPAPDLVVVRLTGDADLSTASLVEDALAQASALGTPRVVVDVARTRFWDCSNLHVLVAFTRSLRSAGRDFRVVGAQPDTRRLIGMANLTGLLGLEAAAAPTRPRATTPRSHRSPQQRWAPVAGALASAGHER